MTRVFVSSDLHLFHRNIIKYCPESRLFTSIEEMHAKIIDNWNEAISPLDLVYILGDITFGKEHESAAILDKLNGLKVLILGNHDKHLMKSELLKSKFVEIHDYLEIKHGKHDVVLFHYEQKEWNGIHHGSFALYGHSHSTRIGPGRSMDIGLDSNMCNPWLLDDVIAILEPKKPLQHH